MSSSEGVFTGTTTDGHQGEGKEREEEAAVRLLLMDLQWTPNGRGSVRGRAKEIVRATCVRVCAASHSGDGRHLTADPAVDEDKKFGCMRTRWGSGTPRVSMFHR